MVKKLMVSTFLVGSILLIILVYGRYDILESKLLGTRTLRILTLCRRVFRKKIIISIPQSNR